MKLLRAALLLCLLLLPRPAPAQQQQTGLCAPVQMVILQQLTLERIGFQATLQVTDNDPNNPITGFAANLTFENPLLSTNGTQNDSSSLFFVQPPTLQNISNVSGNGIIGPGQTATMSWFIIPTVNAGGTNATGIRYNVGASLGGQVNGVAIPASALLVIPATITVAPDAQLQITYFQPRDVIGMDPYTGTGQPDSVHLRGSGAKRGLRAGQQRDDRLAAAPDHGQRAESARSSPNCSARASTIRRSPTPT